MVYTGKFIVFRPLLEWAEGKPSGLIPKYDRFFRILTNIVVTPFMKFICPILDVSILISISSSMFSKYMKSTDEYNVAFYILFALYYSFVIHQMIMSILIASIIICGYSIFLRFRFSQVNLMLKSKKSRNVRRAIVEHQKLCSMVNDYNKITSKPLCVFHILLTFSMDTMLYVTLYGHNPFSRVITGIGFMSVLFASFYTFCTGALFTSEAHKPYKTTNSLMVKKKKGLSIRTSWKVSSALFQSNFK